MMRMMVITVMMIMAVLTLTYSSETSILIESRDKNKTAQRCFMNREMYTLKNQIRNTMIGNGLNI
jgi:capsular polysaccharide biosynthesis protein